MAVLPAREPTLRSYIDTLDALAADREAWLNLSTGTARNR